MVIDLSVQLMQATVQLEQPLGDGTRTVGTGFLISETRPDGRTHIILVTANHVFDKMPREAARIGYRIANPDGSWSYSPQALRIRDPQGRPLWTDGTRFITSNWPGKMAFSPDGVKWETSPLTMRLKVQKHFR